MKYAAFIRGINVGGNSLIRMKDLVSEVENAGFTGVSTYIASGNLLLSSKEADRTKIESVLENVIASRFRCTTKVVAISVGNLGKVLDNVPHDWKSKKDIRCYIAFIKPPTTPGQVMDQLQLRDGVDSASPGPGCVYMTTLMSGIMKSGLKNLITNKIYKELTMRNYNTVLKVAGLALR